jgi:hypothetical protein
MGEIGRERFKANKDDRKKRGPFPIYFLSKEHCSSVMFSLVPGYTVQSL